MLAAGLGDDDDGAGGVEDGAGPGCELAVEADVDGVGEVAHGVFGVVAHVEDLSASAGQLEDFGEIQRAKVVFESSVEGGPLASVEDGVVGEVSGSVGLVDRDEADEFLFRHGLEGVVEAALGADGGDDVRGDVFSAERAGAVGGIDEGVVGEGKELVVDGIVEVATEFVGGPADGGAEVGAADVADKEGVAGEDGVGVDGVFPEIEDEDANGLDGVAGGFEDLEAQAGEFEGVAVFHGDEFVFGLGAGAEADVCAAAVAEFEMAGDEVGMKVGEEDVANLDAERCCIGEVLLDVALGIDDDGGLAGLVGDEVGGVGEAAEEVLLEDH